MKVELLVITQLLNQNCVMTVLLVIFPIGMNFGISAEVVPASERTAQVRDAITSAAGVNTADQLTEAHLAAITELNLRNAAISELQTGDFSGLTGLTNLNLYANELRRLPVGIFEGLDALTSLRLGGNTVDPLPLTIGLEKVAEGKFRAVVLEGAPFDIVLPISVSNGILMDNVTTVTIPIGSMVSESITVNRPPDSRLDATADIGNLPNLPRNHYGYVLSKSETLPIVAIIGNVPPVLRMVQVSRFLLMRIRHQTQTSVIPLLQQIWTQTTPLHIHLEVLTQRRLILTLKLDNLKQKQH